MFKIKEYFRLKKRQKELTKDIEDLIFQRSQELAAWEMNQNHPAKRAHDHIFLSHILSYEVDILELQTALVKVGQELSSLVRAHK